MRIRLLQVSLTGCLLWCAAHAAGELENLKLFKAGGIQSGLWRMQILEGGDPEMRQMMEQSKMAFCADIAKQMAKGAQQQMQQSCTPTILSDTAQSAEVDTTCSDGSRTHVKISKESDKSYIADMLTIAKGGERQTYKARYTYEGQCKTDSVVQMDKDSDACKKMQGVDLAAMCGQVPAQYRAQCEQQARQAASICQ